MASQANTLAKLIFHGHKIDQNTRTTPNMLALKSKTKWSKETKFTEIYAGYNKNKTSYLMAS